MSKIIEVSDEIYDFLMNLSKEIKEQDNRATAMPYFFQVRETKEVPAYNGCGTEILYSSEYETELRDDADKIEWIRDHAELFIEDIGPNTSTYELDDMLESVGFETFNVDTDYTYSNAFFTSKACDDHIMINKHNLNYPVNYLNHAYRNVEMEMIFKFLLGLTK